MSRTLFISISAPYLLQPSTALIHISFRINNVRQRVEGARWACACDKDDTCHVYDVPVSAYFRIEVVGARVAAKHESYMFNTVRHFDNEASRCVFYSPRHGAAPCDRILYLYSFLSSERYEWMCIAQFADGESGPLLMLFFFSYCVYFVYKMSMTIRWGARAMDARVEYCVYICMHEDVDDACLLQIYASDARVIRACVI